MEEPLVQEEERQQQHQQVEAAVAEEEEEDGDEEQRERRESADVFTQEDAVENFLAGESKDDFSDDLLQLSHVDNENEDIEFKSENVLDCTDLEGNVLDDCEELNGTAAVQKVDEEKKPAASVKKVDYERIRRNSLANALKKRSIKCLNKMHAVEDAREGSDVPGAQPSSPGHAEQHPGQEKSSAYSNNNNKEPKNEEETAKEDTTSSINDDNTDTTTVVVKQEQDTEELKPSALENGNVECLKKESDSTEDGGSNDSVQNEETAYPKRKHEPEDSTNATKRMKSELEQDLVIRDKIITEYMEAAGCSTSSIQQIQAQMDQIVSEIRTLNQLAKEKEKEWNNIIHLKKIKEELLLRMQRRKQILILTNDQEHETSPEPQQDFEERVRTKVSLVKNFAGHAKNDPAKRNSLSKQFPNTTIEINGQSSDPKQNRQRPTLDVQTIIADYRQRHPEVVPRRGRRIRSLLNTQGAQGKQGSNSASSDGNSELSLLLTAVDNGKGSKSSDSLDATSFKDVLMEFAKLSKHERQDLLQNSVKTSPYTEVTVHPVPVHAQSASNSLLHGILTKTQSTRSDNSKSTFSPTLARLLTAPERAAAGSPHSNNHTSVSISDMLNNSKARNEITITPVGGQFDLAAKDKSNHLQEEEEAEDSADRLVIDESDLLDGRNRIDNGSDDAVDEVPQCQGCNQKPAQFVCAGCGNQWYCSRECQVVAWDEHSEVCSG